MRPKLNTEFESYVYLDAGELVETDCTVTYEVDCDGKISVWKVIVERDGDNIVDDLREYDTNRLYEEAVENEQNLSIPAVYGKA